jgi:hypothetical protein
MAERYQIVPESWWQREQRRRRENRHLADAKHDLLIIVGLVISALIIWVKG